MVKRNLKLIIAIAFAFGLIACGGGQTDLTYNAAGSDSNNQIPDTSGNDDVFTGTGTANLNWIPPTTYTDGSTLTSLSGHHIYMDFGSGFVRIDTITNPSVSDYLIVDLAPGTYTFTVTAFDSNGIESSFSNTATITINS